MIDLENKLCGVILSGGKSRRMGFPKHKLLLPNGLTYIDSIYMELKKFCKNIVVSGDVSLPGTETIKDIKKNHGPIGGIFSVLESGISNYYFFVSCDNPFFKHKTSRPLLKSFKKKPSSSFHFYRDEKTKQNHFFPCIINKNIQFHIKTNILKNKLSIHSLLDESDYTCVNINNEIKKTITNVNTPKQFKKVWKNFNF